MSGGRKILRSKEIRRECCLVYFEKAFDRVHRRFLCQILDEWGYSQQLIRTVQGLYNGTRIAVKNNYRLYQQISVNQGFRQGYSIAPVSYTHLDVYKRQPSALPLLLFLLLQALPIPLGSQCEVSRGSPWQRYLTWLLYSEQIVHKRAHISPIPCFTAALLPAA